LDLQLLFLVVGQRFEHFASTLCLQKRRAGTVPSLKSECRSNWRNKKAAQLNSAINTCAIEGVQKSIPNNSDTFYFTQKEAFARAVRD
jgi:hypothetical protein